MIHTWSALRRESLESTAAEPTELAGRLHLFPRQVVLRGRVGERHQTIDLFHAAREVALVERGEASGDGLVGVIEAAGLLEERLKHRDRFLVQRARELVG